ncbi:MAG: signal recognition particle-docking protein FtsY [Fimbriimonadia bacterium]|jgi:fused signal recognition particle receptor
MRLGIFKGLRKSVARILGRGIVDDDLFDELEEALLAADASVGEVDEMLQELRQSVRDERLREPEAVRERLEALIADRFRGLEGGELRVGSEKPTVYLFVGVNGVGKTTTIAKLAERFRRRGQTSLLAAADTFRAAASDQLAIWADRTGSQIVRHQEGADPSAVVFDAISAAKARGIDYVLADTAGRQHTKVNLMAELGKIARVTEKALGRPADEVLLVLDANTGQNAIRQAEQFRQAVPLTGLVLTKLDGTSRGGAMLSVTKVLGTPIKLIGVGEKAEDLLDFDPARYAEGLFD